MLDTSMLQRNSVSLCRSAVVQNRQQIVEFASTGHGTPTQSGMLAAGVSAGQIFSGHRPPTAATQRTKWGIVSSPAGDAILLSDRPGHSMLPQAGRQKFFRASPSASIHQASTPPEASSAWPAPGSEDTELGV